MRVLSTFSGISAASVAWKPLGFQFVGFCEPAAFQCHVLNARCDATAPKYLPRDPDFAPKKYKSINGGSVVNFGDICQITDDDLRALGPVDVLEGGSPCQAFSISGLRRGLEDDRGNLTLAFADLALRMREINQLKFVVWENVPGVLSDETCVSAWNKDPANGVIGVQTGPPSAMGLQQPPVSSEAFYLDACCGDNSEDTSAFPCAGQDDQGDLPGVGCIAESGAEGSAQR